MLLLLGLNPSNISLEPIVEQIKQALGFLDVTQLFTKLLLYLPNLIAAAIIVLMGYFFYLVARYFILRAFKRSGVGESVSNVIVKTIRLLFMGTALVMALNQMQIKVITLISTLGVAGIALGLAAQQTLSNMIAGIIILIDHPFREGDFVELDGTYGRVEKITMRSTLLRTLDNTKVDLPNHKIIESRIVNHSDYPFLRVRIPFGIAYKEFIPKAQEVVLKSIENMPQILKNPEPEVNVTNIGESSIDMELMIWIDNPAIEIPLGYELRKRIKMVLDEAGIEIPFPHRQIFLEKINLGDLKPDLPKS
ncbi:MAG: mechanosensitive ion channel [Calditrichaeota bacterium]|nr:mechanosensitive ion channel [Calditrichota bacterium]